jgi:hypothetical protein
MQIASKKFKIMISKTLTIVALLSISFGVNAQTFAEKIAAKKAALESKYAAATANSVSGGLVKLDPMISQSVIAAKWADKEYEVFEGYTKNKRAKSIKLKVIKEGGKVTAIMLDDVKYLGDEDGKSEFVRYYKAGSRPWEVVFSETKIIIFTSTTRGVLTGKYFLDKSGSYDNIKEVKSYLDESRANQQADLDVYASNQKANADKAFEAKKAKFSIEGKKATKIEVTDIKAPNSFGFYRSFTFQVNATLSNGETISTKDGGFWSDYTITYKNGDVKSKEVQDTKFIEGDKILILVQSKFDPNVKATGTVIMDYSETLTMNFNSNNWGKSGSDLKIEMKQRKHATTGKDVVMIKVTDLTGYAKPKYMIIDANQSLSVWTKGYNGYKTVGTGNETGPGQNAGNGGNITVYKDPSVTSFNIDYNTNGGTGGAGTYGYNRGRDGRDGVYKEVIRTVNF